MDRELTEWLRSLAVDPEDRASTAWQHDLSDADAGYLERISRDGTLAAALAELSTGEPELAG